MPIFDKIVLKCGVSETPVVLNKQASDVTGINQILSMISPTIGVATYELTQDNKPLFKWESPDGCDLGIFLDGIGVWMSALACIDANLNSYTTTPLIVSGDAFIKVTDRIVLFRSPDNATFYLPSATLPANDGYTLDIIFDTNADITFDHSIYTANVGSEGIGTAITSPFGVIEPNGTLGGGVYNGILKLIIIDKKYWINNI